MVGKEKLVGRLTLDVKQLRGQIQEANDLLGTIGKGVSLDMTKVVKQRIDALLSDIKAASTKLNEQAVGKTMTAAEKDVNKLLIEQARLRRDIASVEKVNVSSNYRKYKTSRTTFT